VSPRVDASDEEEMKDSITAPDLDSTEGRVAPPSFREQLGEAFGVETPGAFLGSEIEAPGAFPGSMPPGGAQGGAQGGARSMSHIDQLLAARDREVAGQRRKEPAIATPSTAPPKTAPDEDDGIELAALSRSHGGHAVPGAVLGAVSGATPRPVRTTAPATPAKDLTDEDWEAV